MNDCELLFQQVKADPSDRTLLMAYADSLEEAGRTVRAALVRELVEVMQQLEREWEVWYAGGIDSQAWRRLANECWRLQRRLLIFPLQVGEVVGMDEEGRAIPLQSPAQQAIGQVVELVQGWARVQITSGQVWVAAG